LVLAGKNGFQLAFAITDNYKLVTCFSSETPLKQGYVCCITVNSETSRNNLRRWLSLFRCHYQCRPLLRASQWWLGRRYAII